MLTRRLKRSHASMSIKATLITPLIKESTQAMLEIRKSSARGYANHGWLEARHSFSFAEYYDPAHMGFGSLRVINEDKVSGGQGFGTHGHKDMEIVTYVLAGALEHKDSIGNTSVLHYGDVQRMSAGKGVRHSEYNHDAVAPVHLLQIWLTPHTGGIEPSYEEKHFDLTSKHHQLRLIASPNGRDGSVTIHQDALIYASILGAADSISYAIAPTRLVYLHVATGELCVNGIQLFAGDALKITDIGALLMNDAKDAEILLFDMQA